MLAVSDIIDEEISFNEVSHVRYFDRDVECVFKFFSKRSVIFLSMSICVLRKRQL